MYRGRGVSSSGGAGFRGRGGAGGMSRGGRGGGGGYGDRGGRGGFVPRGGGFGDRGGRGGGFSDRGGRGGGFSRGGGGGRDFGDRGGRGGGGFSRGGGRGAGRGFGRGGNDQRSANTKVTFDSDDGSDAASAAGSSDASDAPVEKKMRNVETVIREDGTEVPAKLNNKVFVDQLPYEEPQGGAPLFDQLRDFAAQWKVGKAVALMKKPGQGFGYLAFRSPACVDVAVKVLNGRKFLGRTLRVEVPKPPREKSNSGAQRVDPTTTPFERQALLTDLSKVSEPEVIREVLREYAPALEPKVEAIKMAGGGRKAFVTLATPEDVETFVGFMNGFRLLGRTIGAEAARPPGSLPYSMPTARTAAPQSSSTGADGGATRKGAGSRTTFDDDDDDEDGAGNNKPAGAQPSAIDVAMGVAPSSIAGSNANKKYPMPDLLDPASKSSATKSTEKTSKRREDTGDHKPKFDLADQGAKEIVIGNVPEDATVTELKKHFASCGRVMSAELLVNDFSKDFTGLAKVKFAIPGHAKHAVKTMNGSVLHGNMLRIDREGDDDNPDSLVVPGPLGITPAGPGCDECDTAAPAPKAAAPANDDGKKGKKKRSKRDRLASIDVSLPPEDEDQREEMLDTLAKQYDVSKDEVRTMMADADTEPTPDARRQTKGRADPTKKRSTTKEFLEANAEAKSAKKKNRAEEAEADVAAAAASTKKKATKGGAREGVVSFDAGDDDFAAGKAALDDDDDEEEVFRDVDVRPTKKTAQKSAGAKKKGGKGKKV